MRIHCKHCGQIHNAKDPCPKPDQLKKAVKSQARNAPTSRKPFDTARERRREEMPAAALVGTPVNVRFSDELLAKLDKERGPLNRQDMIRKLVEEL